MIHAMTLRCHQTPLIGEIRASFLLLSLSLTLMPNLVIVVPPWTPDSVNAARFGTCTTLLHQSAESGLCSLVHRSVMEGLFDDYLLAFVVYKSLLGLTVALPLLFPPCNSALSNSTTN